MAEKFTPSSGNGPRNRIFPVVPRVVAIIIMVIGVIGFAATLVKFGDQVPLLLASTLVTFLGLGLIIAGRRQMGADSSAQDENVSANRARTEDVESRSAQIRNMPRGLRAAARGRSTASTRLAHPSQNQAAKSPEEALPPALPSAPHFPSQPRIQNARPDEMHIALDEVIDTLEAHGAQVNVETQQENRAILNITGSDGQVYTALVHQNSTQVDVADVRALYAMVTSSASQGGFLISAGPFTQRAYDWAGTRPIRLVVIDELDEISI